MESELAAGGTINGCAIWLSHVADVEGITGAMYGFALGILKECWVHGEALMAWHRKDGA